MGIFHTPTFCVFLFQVMLLANPSLEELYHKSCALAEDPQEVRDSFQHPARLIKVQYSHSLFVLCTWVYNDVIILFHCWVLTMWKSPNWCWLTCKRHWHFCFGLGILRGMIIWIRCWPLCLSPCLYPHFYSFFHHPHPFIHIPYFHLTYILWLSYVPVCLSPSVFGGNER